MCVNFAHIEQQQQMKSSADKANAISTACIPTNKGPEKDAQDFRVEAAGEASTGEAVNVTIGCE
jgi:hypothetical protein